MNFKTLFHWFYEHVRNYNLFMPKVDVENDEPEPPAVVLNRQRYTTWLYILLLIVSLYIVFYIASMKPQLRTMTVSNITLAKFKQLQLEHRKTLSCPCSTIRVPYKIFVSNTIKYHPVCSSFFVSQQWIEALYRLDASKFDGLDFRKTAHSQFKILASLCSLSKDTMFQNKFDLDNHEFVTLYLLNEEQVQSEAIAIVERFKNSAITRIISFINYLRIITQANYFVSALNTNLVIAIQENSGEYSVVGGWMQFYKSSGVGLNEEMICGNANPIRPAGFYEEANNWFAGFDSILRELDAFGMVPGFFAGCTPFEALLPSTLDCLYDVKCLELLLDFFPSLHRTQLNWTEDIMTKQQQNVSLHNHLLKLFLEEWSTKLNYSMYFDQCAASHCTYSIIQQTNFASALTLLISLYGGFVFILRLIAPLLVNIALKIGHRSRNIAFNSEYFRTYLRKFTISLKRLNLFKEENDHSESSIKQQKMTTRVYLILLIGTFLIFALYTSLTTQTSTITESNPSLDTYTILQVLHPNTLTCPCSTIAISYEKFISLFPVLHQVCSSDFVSKSWISILMTIINQLIPIDWRNQAGPQFQLLSDLCQLANKTIDDAVHRFIIQSFITSNLLPESDFYIQINATLDQFFHSTVIYFDQLIDTVRLHMQVDQPFIHLGRIARASTANIIVHFETNETTDQQSVQFDLSLIGTHDINSRSINCVCATNPHCQSLVAIYDTDDMNQFHNNPSNANVIPGLTAGCYIIDSLMLSTLECFYSHSDCLPIINRYIREMYYRNVDFPQWFEVRPLIYDRNLSRFPPNTSISKIVKEMMIERWNPSSLYNRYYELCAPSYCTYSDRIRTNTDVEIIVALVSTIGGLASSLSLITPYLVKFFYYVLIMMCERRQQQDEQQVRPKWFIRLKTAIQKLFTLLYTTLIEYNMFTVRDFTSNIDRITVKRLGQWATRFYIVLLIIGLAIFALYVAIQPETLTKTFDKPSLDEYNRLKQIHGEKLECFCSVIASKYSYFVNIEPQFHQICSSPFVSNEWQMNLAIGLVSNLSIYDIRDYRRFLLAHLQYLTGLCQISIEAVNTTINQFLSSLFVTTKLVTNTTFFAHLDTKINQSKTNAPIIFNQLLFLIRNINDGNSIISTYGSNYQYTIRYDPYDEIYAHTRANIYENNCTCGLHYNCTTQAIFIKTNPSTTVSIKGLKMGCIPSESFHASTLECFYDLSCIDLIQEYTNRINSTYILAPLSNTMLNRFSLNTTIDELIRNLFIESWKTTTNYSVYFKKCAPSLCSYTYIYKFNSFYTISLLLGFQGGLTIVLEWICPKIIQIIFKLYQRQKRRTNVIQPVNTVQVTPTQTVGTGVPILTVNSGSLPTTVTTSQINISSRKIIIICVLLLFVIAALTIFSIYFARHEKNQVLSTNFPTTMTSNVNLNMTTSTIASTSIITASTCQLKFQPITILDNASFAPFSPVTSDFNSDGQLDFATLSGYMIVHINIFLGNGNGTFQPPITLPGINDYSSFVVDDFNNDQQLDLAFCTSRTRLVGVWLGNGNGSFEGPVTSSTEFDYPLKIIVADFNNDNYLDVTVMDNAPHDIGIFLGNGDGSFTKQSIFSVELGSYPATLVASDFNNDDYQDIIIGNTFTNHIVVFLGYGNGTFIAQKKAFVGPTLYPNSIAVGDFDDDTRLDIVLSYQWKNAVSIMFGYGNGSLSERKSYIIRTSSTYDSSIVVNDFNHDNHLDVVIGGTDPYSVNVLLGYGNGTFDVQMIFSTKFTSDSGSSNKLHLAIGDFNNDGYQDIVAANYWGFNMIILLNTCECCASKKS